MTDNSPINMISHIQHAMNSPGVHEQQISALYPGATHYEGGQVFDKPLVVLAFTNRSGSNLLADYMLGTGQFVGLGEMLNYDMVSNVKHRRGLESFPEYMLKMGKAMTREASQRASEPASQRASEPA